MSGCRPAISSQLSTDICITVRATYIFTVTHWPVRATSDLMMLATPPIEKKGLYYSRTPSGSLGTKLACKLKVGPKRKFALPPACMPCPWRLKIRACWFSSMTTNTTSVKTLVFPAHHLAFFWCAISTENTYSTPNSCKWCAGNTSSSLS